MIEFKKAVVKKIEKAEEYIQEIFLDIDHPCKKAINYIEMTGPVNPGNIVLVNTTASTLNLGTGGYHYIMANFNSPTSQKLPGYGHGMKLKYTPNQINILFAEEQDSLLHEKFNEKLDLKRKLIFIGELHSMIVPLCAHIKFRSENKKKIACIITDHGALPVWFSKNIRLLKSKGLLDTVISIGNAFGGDYECVNIYTALQLATNILNMDASIISMGPGIMGTGTSFGFSGLELGFYLDFCHSKSAQALFVPRISFKDVRSRHYGISHHFINMFKELVIRPVPIVLPYMDSKKNYYVLKQLRESGILSKHPIAIRNGRTIICSLTRYGLNPTTMGRGIDDDPEFFYAAGAVVDYALMQNSK
ncbi:MAG: DUF3866 family protein [Caldicoprobacterales bacterium]|mgnify:FL=1|nr:DUF3866 family protein [Clostridiales bacterium]